MRWRLVAVAVVSVAVFGAQTAHASVIQMTPNNIGLVGYWSFNEGTSTIAHDYSGNGNTGTLSTTGSTLPQWVPGKFGDALLFSHSAQSNVLTTLTTQLTDFTACAWFNPQNTTNNFERIIDKAYDNGFWLGHNQAAANEWGGGIEQTSSPYGLYVTLSPNVWHYLCMSRSGTTQTVNADGGAQIVTQTVSGSAVDTTPVRIGTSYNTPSADTFNGSIDEVRIYNRALSATEVAGLYQSGLAKINTSQSPGTLSQGLVGWWTMDGADTVWSSATAGSELDHSGNGNTGTLTNMNQSTSPTVGKVGQALSFDGNSYVQMGQVTSAAHTGTVSAWVNFTAIESWGFIAGNANWQNDINGYGLSLHGATAGFRGEIDNGSGQLGLINTTNSNYNDGKWHLVVFSWDGSNLNMYVDGASAASPVSYSGDPVVNVNNFSVGNPPSGNSYYFMGSIDDVRIYDRALSASEIEQLYNLGAGTHVNTSSANLQNGSSVANGLVGYWTFDGSDISGSTVYDLSGNGNNGTNNGATATIGKLGQALSFDGSTNYVDTGITSETPFSNTTFAISAWIKCHNGCYNGSFFAGKWGYDSGFWMAPDSMQLKTSNCERDSDGVINVYDNNWHLITWVVTTDTGSAGGNILHLYQDGVLHDGSSLNCSTYTYTPATGHSLTIGGRLNTGHQVYFDGSIDDFRVYDRALSASEVQYLYNMGK